MRKLSTLLFCSFLSMANAQESGEGPGGHKGKGLEEAKKHALEMIDMRIKDLQESRSCVVAATSKEAMHACKKDAKEDMKEFKGKRDEYKKEWKEKRENWKGKRDEWKKRRGEAKSEGGPRPEDMPPPPENE